MGFSDSVSDIPLCDDPRSLIRAMTRGFEMCSLDDVNTCSLPGSGCVSFSRGQVHWIRGWEGTVHGIYPWVVTLVMGNLMGSRFG